MGETRDLRRDLVGLCAVVRAQLERAHDDQVARGAAAAAQADRAHDDAAAIVAKVEAVRQAVGDGDATTSTVKLSGEDRDGLAAMYDGVRGGLWWLAGIPFALLLAAGFVWATRPDR
ncbi:hypothetical protein [Patulibacter medicamentivorans]|uniref:hypothetical protein n=1 Tax=Patulibacter medicamentivorans TaxID=1097667 RepID=UPI00058B360B|nr:hypothetical protein [Patulibacter medicamentivorans]